MADEERRRTPQFYFISTKATLRFRFQAEGGREIIEDVNATLVWQRGETVGMEFETPLLAGSPAAQKSSNLEAYIAKKEATGGK